ncbi:MAG: hypothetical protein ABR66_04060 [Microbacteriaceae bacterium BACL25 MAG-120322-bin65]|nr:MAG: hypothetical protein ABR66_04060 [Microbacteriaceae bacterium BACL25 MAG-120322-bin65]
MCIVGPMVIHPILPTPKPNTVATSMKKPNGTTIGNGLQVSGIVSGLLWWVAIWVATWIFWLPFVLYQRVKSRKDRESG